jgi:hypothetical protein
MLKNQEVASSNGNGREVDRVPRRRRHVRMRPAAACCDGVASRSGEHPGAFMSYELVFWRQAAMMSQSSTTTYEALKHHQPVEGLSDLPIDQVLSEITSSFPNSQRGSDGSDDWITWSSADDEDSFRVTWSSQHFRVECHHVPLDQVNRLVKIGEKFGCPLYDPQTGERFRFSGQ